MMAVVFVFGRGHVLLCFVTFLPSLLSHVSSDVFPEVEVTNQLNETHRYL